MSGLYGDTAHGRILGVRDEILGDHLSTAAVATDTALLLDDLSVFTETGGQALLVEDATADELVTYTGYDATETGLLLSAALTADHAVGTTVQVYPQKINRVAYVQLDDPEREPVPVRVPFSLKDRVAIGPRSAIVGDDDDDATTPEEVLIHLEHREWELADVLRQDVAIDPVSVDFVTGNRSRIETFTDFLAPTTNLQAGDFAGNSTGTAAAIIAEAAVTEGHRGVWELQTGTSSSGCSRVSTHTGTTSLAGGRIRIGALVHVPGALSDGTDRYTMYFGLINDPLESATTRGVYIRYRDNLNSGAWQARAISAITNGTDPLNDNGGAVTIAAGDWVLLELEATSSGDQADFYINGALKGSISGDALPASGAPLEIRFGIEKVIGTTNRGADIDYAYYQEELSARR